MIVDIKKISSTMDKISALTSGDKNIPGVMFDTMTDKDNGLLRICFNDGHKALMEVIEAQYEDTDKIGKIAFTFEQLQRAISNCQPSGIIKTAEIKFVFNGNNVNIISEQMMDILDNDGNVVDTKVLGTKKMLVPWMESTANMKTQLLDRMDYDSIFNSDIVADSHDKDELSVALNKTSTEKGKQIYLSKNTQCVFVLNQAHFTCVPMTEKELSTEDMDRIRGEVSEKFNGQYTEEQLNEAIQSEKNVINHSIILTQSTAKSLVSIMSKMANDKVNIYRNGSYCYIFSDTDSEKIGIMLEMPAGNKIHTGALERYTSFQYGKYQMNITREFLLDIIKSALSNSGVDKVTFKVENTETGEKKLNITVNNYQASVSDSYDVLIENLVDPSNDIESKVFNISLKVIYDMISQLNSNTIAFDFECAPDGTTTLRIADIDRELMITTYNEMREQTAKLCAEQGIAFDINSTPTPVELKIMNRNKTLKTKQYTMLSK